MSNVLHLGDRLLCQLPWAAPGNSFPVVVRGFSCDGVWVEADPPSDDPEVENDWIVRFSDVAR